MAPPETSPLADASAKVLGEMVRRRRRELRLKQQDLADLAEVSVRFVHDLEHGKATVQLTPLLLVLDALGLRISIGPGQGPLIGPHD